MQKKLIECFSYVHGRKEAEKLYNTLNELKSNKNSSFTLREVRTNVYLIRGSVTKKDWVGLNLECDFMEI